MSQLSFYLPMLYQLVVISVDATGAHIFRFYDNIVSLSSGVPSLNALRWNDTRQGRAYPQQSACVENSKTISSPTQPPPPPQIQNLRNKEQKNATFHINRSKDKNITLWLMKRGLFFFLFFFKEKETDFQNSIHGSCEISMEKIDRCLKTRHKPLKCALLLF